MKQAETIELPSSWGWLLALGIMMIFGGSLGIFWAFYFTIVSVLFFGAILLVGGVLQIWHEFTQKSNSWSARLMSFAVAAAYLILGGLFLWDPVSGAISLTLVLIAFLIFMGGLRFVFAWRYKKHGWHWKLMGVGGLLNFILVGIIIWGWPEISLWLIGMFVAIDMLFNGWWLISIALAVRTLKK